MGFEGGGGTHLTPNSTLVIQKKTCFRDSLINLIVVICFILLIFIKVIYFRPMMWLLVSTACVNCMGFETPMEENQPWTNFRKQNKTWAEFSTLDMGVCVFNMYFLHYNKTA
jgi:hypothetical protein